MRWTKILYVLERLDRNQKVKVVLMQSQGPNVVYAFACLEVNPLSLQPGGKADMETEKETENQMKKPKMAREEYRTGYDGST